MELRKKMSLKIVAAVLLLVLAGGFAFVVKELLSSRRPENSLPAITIACGGVNLPAEHWMLDSYSWRFLFLVKEWHTENREAWKNLEAFPVLPGAILNISFSSPSETVHVTRMRDGGSTFEELSGELHAPLDEGIYIYRVEANWGSRGSIAYFFKVKV